MDFGTEHSSGSCSTISLPIVVSFSVLIISPTNKTGGEGIYPTTNETSEGIFATTTK